MKKHNRCKLCEEYYKKYPLSKANDCELVHKIKDNYQMSPISCYFVNSSKEWNCQTVGLIRDLVYEGQELKYGIQYMYCEDQKYATIKIDGVLLGENRIGTALWLTWYKQRGSTDALWILDDYNKPRKPTEEELLTIVEYYKNIKETK